MWFGAIARHPEQGTDCALCEQGRAALCGDCFVLEVSDRRELLRCAKVSIGEPAWPLGPAHERLAAIHRPGEEQT